MRINHTGGSDPDFIGLCRKLDEFLNEIAGGESCRAQYIPYNTLEDIHDAVVAYDGAKPVGCAAFRHCGEKTAELKRVFVEPEYRGRGVSGLLMDAVETRAREKGYARLILESGEPLITAMRLYRRRGYRVIPNYGPYKGMVESVCMEKRL